jgi:hypothetical protein
MKVDVFRVKKNIFNLSLEQNIFFKQKVWNAKASLSRKLTTKLSRKVPKLEDQPPMQILY